MQVSMCYFKRMETLEIYSSFFKIVIFINKNNRIGYLRKFFKVLK